MKQLVLLSGLFFIGGCCCSRDLSKIPLTEGEIPYALPAGTYTDSKGLLHIETNQRWSVSEGDFYKMILAYTKDTQIQTNAVKTLKR